MSYFLIILLFVASSCCASEIEIKTGYGYIQDVDGKVVTKTELPKGLHSLKEGYTYFEVKNAKELEKVECWQEPTVPPKTDKEKLLDLLKDKDVQTEIQSIKQPI